MPRAVGCFRQAGFPIEAYPVGWTTGVWSMPMPSFNVSGTSLRATSSFNFETKSSYTVTVRVTDAGGLTFDKNFVVTVNSVNGAPTDIALSNNSVDENQPVNTVVGALTATDPDAGATTAPEAAAVSGVALEPAAPLPDEGRERADDGLDQPGIGEHRAVVGLDAPDGAQDRQIGRAHV